MRKVLFLLLITLNLSAHAEILRGTPPPKISISAETSDMHAPIGKQVNIESVHAVVIANTYNAPVHCNITETLSAGINPRTQVTAIWVETIEGAKTWQNTHVLQMPSTFNTYMTNKILSTTLVSCTELSGQYAQSQGTLYVQ